MELADIEKLYCNIPKELEVFTEYFRQQGVYDIPPYIFTQEKYTPLREYALYYTGFSVVTQRNCEVLKHIIGTKRVLEVMCGMGSYSATLKKLGVQCISTDDMSWMNRDSSRYYIWKNRLKLNAIEHLDAAEAIMKYGEDVSFILMSWPPQNKPYAEQAIRAMRAVNSDCRMIYIGEWQGGCTANDGFFSIARDVTKQFPLMVEANRCYRHWVNCGYHDRQYILE